MIIEPMNSELFGEDRQFLFAGQTRSGGPRQTGAVVFMTVVFLAVGFVVVFPKALLLSK